MTFVPPDSVLSAAQARAAGITRWSLRSGGYRAARHDVHVRADLDTSHPDVRIAIAAVALPQGAVLGGWAAARVHERAFSDRTLDLFDGRLPGFRTGPEQLPVLVTGESDTRVQARRGVRVYRSVVPTEHRAEIDGVPVTSALRTAFDLARLWPTVPAVVAVDRLTGLGLTSLDELAQLVDEHPRWRGVGAARRVVRLADPGAESPRETLLRLVWQAAGFPRPLCNPVLSDARGRFLARVDLFDPHAGVVGEYDGEVHADAVRRADDARRHEALEDAGLVLVRAAAPDLATPPGREAWRRRLAAAYARSTRTSGDGWRTSGVAAPPAAEQWSAAAVRPLKWSDLAPPRAT